MRPAIFAAALLAAIPAAQAQTKTVTPDDLFAFPHRYEQKTVRLASAGCIFVEKGDYRCTTGFGVSVFATEMQPDAIRETMERDCTSIRDITRRPCQFAIEFEVTSYNRDQLAGGRDRLVVRPWLITAKPYGKP